ncbi:hypothetical protein AB0I81_39985 [Nonomuraea sp. NPDC050404]|uniref:hypothetical protein n=1 Tax=Nonomuraea sp. NPDC050404 TaxID=3155783 RepID=UPI0033EACF6E
MTNHTPHAGTVGQSAARTTPLDTPLGRYIDRRLHAALATLASPDADRAARHRARAIRDEMNAVISLLDGVRIAERVADIVGRPPTVDHARAYYRRYAEQFARNADQATREQTRRMFDVAAAEMETIAGLLDAWERRNDGGWVVVLCGACRGEVARVDAGDDLAELDAARKLHACPPLPAEVAK